VYTRVNETTTATGSMAFDTADIDALIAQGSFGPVILHEMAHVIGFGTLLGYVRRVRQQQRPVHRQLGPEHLPQRIQPAHGHFRAGGVGRQRRHGQQPLERGRRRQRTARQRGRA
jgi:hypothetical protein